MKIFVWALVVVAVGIAVFRFLPESGRDRPGLSGGRDEAESSLVDGMREYSSVEFSFAFRYPSSWILTEAGRGVVILKPSAEISDDEAPISIDASGDVPFEESVAEMSQNLVGGGEREASAGGLGGMRFAGGLRPELGESADTYFIFTMLNRAGRLFSLDYRETSTADKSLRAVYEGVVDSLRFGASR